MSLRNNSPNTVRGKRVIHPVTHNGRCIGTIDVPKNIQMTSKEYAFAKDFLLALSKDVDGRKTKTVNNRKYTVR